ncbi:hypothetical protein ACERIM_12285 [Natrinema sp. H-ect1]|uniref:hypothetical protein n=1 Tax=Natrinema sp. H-ect1 TaxID=3242700 RepID=UPI00359D84CD
MAEKEKIQFRGKADREASEIVDRMRPEGINISEIAQQGFREKLRETLSDEEKIMLHQRYNEGEISEEVAEVLIGDALREIEREQDAFKMASKLDTRDVFQG